MSPSIGKLVAALAKAQGKIRPAEKDSANPAFKRDGSPSRYASLTSIWESCRQVLSEHDLAVVQLVSSHGKQVTVTTMLTHSSGEWIRASVTASAESDGPQKLGSAITYCRRYGLAAMVGVVNDEDDDGNSAEGKDRPLTPAPKRHEPRPEPPGAEMKAPVDWKKKIDGYADADAMKKELFAPISALPEPLQSEVKAYYAAHKKKLAKPASQVTKELLEMGREPGIEG